MNLLDTPYELSPEQINFYQTNRFIKLKNVFDAETLARYNDVISEQVAKMNTVTTALDERDTYGKAFLQLFNLWRENDAVRAFVFSKRLAKIAADLMQVDGVRMYHDQALFKEGGGGITPWHADQYYWPLSSDKTITAWIPLQPVPLEMGPLEFSAGSHQIVEGRELSIGDDSEKLIAAKLRVTDFKHVIEPFDLGEVSFHSGWVFHRAGANVTDQMRKVMTVIYMDRDMVLQQPINKNQENDWHTWCPGARIGQVIDTALNPVLY
ncbi:phytanoyl-CoA dioxygenase family protein [Fibrivirga algicola]|uniref:Phytanoyl-CoA dioxygenase family protein n=1 Tax=Fibrivirga algicola TaxID=2950420 RepID=A0ABX0QDG8_9BACT|nr:phytanoyl-CoA dioxygenase family protein [Fibrivirga algicola]ARK10619.1 phytanoyl-CoA dioxygenase [Fibrella sp. ES10-3-2-2]NID10171.1 phytanoyl-CoA dioxygenase family protein [Fibrivirga algicola]